MIKVDRSTKPEYLRDNADQLRQNYLAARQAWENAPSADRKRLKKEKENAENKYNEMV